MGWKRFRSATIAAAVAFIPASISAHHGAAAYDLATKTTLDGTVASFEWENPHALIHFAVIDGAGQIQKWTAETAGPVLLVRAGWNKNALQPGDRCTIVGHRAKNASNTMILDSLVLSNGKQLTNYVP